MSAEALPSPEAGAVRRVLVVHGDPRVRRSIAERLRLHGVTTIVEVASVVEARTAVRAPGPWDLAVVGFGWDNRGDDDGDVPALLDDLHARRWPHVVVMMPWPRVRAVAAVLNAGATGVLLADAVARQLHLVTVNPGSVNPRSVHPPGQRFVADVAGAPRALSTREQEVLQLAADGYPNREIGERLGLSPLTIKSHLSRIGRRLGSGDRAHLVLLALRAGVIT